ncbi:hypothetical protein ROHU_010889 [Labeo rohita]|uniref:Uncharacterized protein n=1 Tax=Labeo rohita TaxID=84645 RepID=A0A498LYG7_LABRO|nr:hypothetical protein ROHU_010889 [Labeo rohita]
MKKKALDGAQGYTRMGLKRMGKGKLKDEKKSSRRSTRLHEDGSEEDGKREAQGLDNGPQGAGQKKCPTEESQEGVEAPCTRGHPGAGSPVSKAASLVAQWNAGQTGGKGPGTELEKKRKSPIIARQGTLVKIWGRQ